MVEQVRMLADVAYEGGYSGTALQFTPPKSVHLRMLSTSTYTSCFMHSPIYRLPHYTLKMRTPIQLRTMMS